MMFDYQTTSIKSQVTQDIWNWIETYIEANNKFYDYKFPVCPFAKKARLDGVVEVQAWESGSYKQFIKQTANALIANPEKNISVIVMPPRAKWTWGIPALIEKLNAESIPQGYFLQYGTAVQTNSLYPGLFNSNEYFVVMVNQVNPVLDGHKSLLRTDYYKNWASEHWNNVVVRRQELYEKYQKKS